MVAQASLGGCNTGAKATSEGPGLHMLGLAVVNHVTLHHGGERQRDKENTFTVVILNSFNFKTFTSRVNKKKHSS